MSGDEAEVTSNEPEDPGTELSQSQAPPEELANLARRPDRGGVSLYPVSESIRLLQEPGVRGQAGMILLYTSVHGLEEQLRQLRDERDEAAGERDRLREKLHECVTNNKVLGERIRSGARLSYLQNAANTLGSLILGVAIPLLMATVSGGMLTLALLGLGLLVMGWFPTTPSSKVD